MKKERDIPTVMNNEDFELATSFLSRRKYNNVKYFSPTTMFSLLDGRFVWACLVRLYNIRNGNIKKYSLWGTEELAASQLIAVDELAGLGDGELIITADEYTRTFVVRPTIEEINLRLEGMNMKVNVMEDEDGWFKVGSV